MARTSEERNTVYTKMKNQCLVNRCLLEHSEGAKKRTLIIVALLGSPVDHT